MSNYLCIAVTFLDPRFHGRGDAGSPEWPPSPLRLLQALVAANADEIGLDGDLDHALTWLERQKPPLIVAPAYEKGEPYCLSVPNNAMDIVGKAWSKGNYFGGGDANPATHRTMKTVRPMRMIDANTIRYIWRLAGASKSDSDLIQPLIKAARRLVALGWGIDMVVGQGDIISASELQALPGEYWSPTISTSSVALRTPIQGTLLALQHRYESFIHRIAKTGFVPVEPLTRFKITGYRRPTDAVARPFAIFELRTGDGSLFRYSPRRLIHIAGMARHLAIRAMKNHPPLGFEEDGEDWVETYVAGHQQSDDPESFNHNMCVDDTGHDSQHADSKSGNRHRQLSYLPLLSVGHPQTDPGVRRIMIAAPVGHDEWLGHVARHLSGQVLQPLRGDEFKDSEPPLLVRVQHDTVARFYTQPSNSWASVTPVILPGHDDHKPAKTSKLILKALAQSGIEQPCNYEWSPFSRFPKSLSAHKYDRDKRPTGYIRPDHLLSKTAVHLTLRFDDGVKVPGPLAIGAGRHCGLGIFASIDGE